jgi:hypothetical protein
VARIARFGGDQTLVDAAGLGEVGLLEVELGGPE